MADPGAVGRRLERGEHRRVGDRLVRRPGGRADHRAELAVRQPNQGSQWAGPELCRLEYVGDGRDAPVRHDHPGKRPVGVAHPARHLHMPLPHDGIDRGRTDEGLIFAARMLQGVGKIVGAARVQTDRLGHGRLDDAAMFIGHQHVEADALQRHGLIVPGLEVEVLRIASPGDGQKPKGLIQCEKLAIDLGGKIRRIVLRAGCDAGFGLLALRGNGTQRAEPGQRDESRGGKQDQRRVQQLADELRLHRRAAAASAWGVVRLSV